LTDQAPLIHHQVAVRGLLLNPVNEEIVPRGHEFGLSTVDLDLPLQSRYLVPHEYRIGSGPVVPGTQLIRQLRLGHSASAHRFGEVPQGLRGRPSRIGTSLNTEKGAHKWQVVHESADSSASAEVQIRVI
jgi:hypothetical protein